MANGAPRCHPANRPFHDRLEKLRLDCGCKGYYSQEKTYSRALQAVRRYPLPLRSTHEVADLDGMGKACARIFEEIRQKQEPVGQEAEDEWRKCAKQRLLKALSSKAKVSRREAKGLKPQSSVAQPKRGRPRGRGGKGRGGRGKGRGKGGGKTWGKGRSKCSKGSEGSGGAADRHADIEEDDQPLSQLLNPSTPDRSQSSKPFVALTPPSRAHQATPATSPEPTQVASQRSWLEIPEPLTPTLVMRSPLTGGCELLASALASAPASQDSQSGELHVEPVNLGDEGVPEFYCIFVFFLVCVCPPLDKGFSTATSFTDFPRTFTCRGVWHSRPTTRNEAVGESGKQGLISPAYLPFYQAVTPLSTFLIHGSSRFHPQTFSCRRLAAAFDRFAAAFERVSALVNNVEQYFSADFATLPFPRLPSHRSN